MEVIYIGNNYRNIFTIAHTEMILLSSFNLSHFEITLKFIVKTFIIVFFLLLFCSAQEVCTLPHCVNSGRESPAKFGYIAFSNKHQKNQNATKERKGRTKREREKREREREGLKETRESHLTLAARTKNREKESSNINKNSII